MSNEQTAEEFVKDLAAAKTEIQKLQQSNVDKVRALAASGKIVDPAVLANLKIDTFIETFLDDQAQLVYVRNLEIRLRDMLDEALKQVRQEQVTQGVPASKGLLLPNGVRPRN